MCAAPPRRATHRLCSAGKQSAKFDSEWIVRAVSGARTVASYSPYYPRMATSSISSPAATATAGPVPARWTDLVLLALRVVVGLMYACHGAQKLFGWFGGPGGNGGSVPLPSLPGLAGVLELVGGLLIVVGLSTRAVAFVLAGEMAIAYFLVHAGRGFFPIVNRGEVAVLYCFIFLVLWAVGPGAYSLDGRRGLARAV